MLCIPSHMAGRASTRPLERALVAAGAAGAARLAAPPWLVARRASELDAAERVDDVAVGCTAVTANRAAR